MIDARQITINVKVDTSGMERAMETMQRLMDHFESVVADEPLLHNAITVILDRDKVARNWAEINKVGGA